MELIPSRLCSQDLQFEVFTPWPSFWPPFAFKKWQISGFQSTSEWVLNFTDPPFLDLFFSSHPGLSGIELAHISGNPAYQKVPGFSYEGLFLKYGLRQDPKDIHKILSLLLQTPPAFQTWMVQKKAHLNEIKPLGSPSLIKSLNPFFKWLSLKQPSRTQGLQALRWCVELMLTGKGEGLFPFPSHSPVSEDLKSLERKRKPLALGGDEAKNLSLQNQSWPSHTQTRWTRKGDEAGVEVLLWGKSQKDLQSKFHQILHTPLPFSSFRK